MACKYDRDAEIYLNNDKPCKVDGYGDPTYHCRARRTCGRHIGKAELTCALHVADARRDLRRVLDLAPLMIYQALGDGVDSEAMTLAGPGADYRVFSARRTLDRLWLMDHVSATKLERAMQNLLPDDDRFHPFEVLTRWHVMVAEGYGHPIPEQLTTTGSGAYLDRQLSRLAQDPTQDFALLVREVRRCRAHLEAVIRNSHAPEHGAPCPTCEPPSPRLNLVRGHWCTDTKCEKFHYPDDPDRYVCPRNRDHWWTETDYRKWVADVYEASRSA